MEKLYDCIERVLLDRTTIAKRVGELGKELSKDYEGKCPILVCILKGSCIFYADLMRNIDIPVRFDFMHISSYGNSSTSSGEVKIIDDLVNDIKDRDVIIVEDIVDSGKTLYNLLGVLKTRKPASLKICALLDKPERREAPIEADYLGFTVPNEFIVGYGLDYAEKYRNIPDICVVDSKAIK